MNDLAAFRVEPIMAFTHDPTAWAAAPVLGYEVLRGRHHCPLWRPPGNWRAWYLATMTRALPPLAHRLLPGQKIFLNISSTQILDPIIQALVTACPYADRLVVEWIETPTRRVRLAAAARLFAHLRAVGVQVAIDDVGSAGQDGFGRLALTGADYLKVDGRLLVRARRHEAARATLRALVAAAHDGGGMRLIVEWVETLDDWRLARDCGADAWQGFLSREAPLACALSTTAL